MESSKCYPFGAISAVNCDFDVEGFMGLSSACCLAGMGGFVGRGACAVVGEDVVGGAGVVPVVVWDSEGPGPGG